MGKIDRCGDDLRDWNKAGFGDLNKEMKKVKQGLIRDLEKNMKGSNVGKRRALEERERELMKREEIMWFQRARANEFKWGDRNTSFFHKKASGRKKKEHC